MLMRFDPLREFDRLTQEAFGAPARPTVMPMDAYREGDKFVVHFDVPGVDPDSIELTLEKNVLSVSAERDWHESEGRQVIAAERFHGTFNRQLFLGEGLDADNIDAVYDQGVLTVTVPVAEQAKPRKVQIHAGNGRAKAIDTGSTAT